MSKPITTDRCAVLFVHGIVGNNSIFDFLTPALPDGIAVRRVSLEGHGGNALDFSKASMKRWKAQVTEASSRANCPHPSAAA